MPIIKSAIKKERKDKVRTIKNRRREGVLDKVLKQARKNPTVKNLGAAYSALDKAAKVHLIHRNRASRLKARLSKKTAAK